MKYVIIRCEDGARPDSKSAVLLDGAKTAFLQQLAHAGAAGFVRRHADSRVINRLSLHRGLLGLTLKRPEPAEGQCYAASVNLKLAQGESVWCCDFVTHQEGVIIDPNAGHITTRESALLIQALNMELGSETRRWEVGSGSHQLFITHDPALKPDASVWIPSPEMLLGDAWQRAMPKHPVAEAARLLVEQAKAVLEQHPVNRVRTDLNENPANFMWLWGGAALSAQPSFQQRTGLSGAVISHSFPLRGLAKTLALEWKAGPAVLDEVSVDRVSKDVAQLLQKHDLVYVHFRVTSDDAVQRLCAMERIDQRLLKPLSEQLRGIKDWRLLAAIDDRASGSVPFVAIGSGLPQQPVAQLQGRGAEESPLSFDDSAALFSWFTRHA